MSKFWSPVKQQATVEMVENRVEEVFPFIADDMRHVISIVGAGGKTSLLYALAKACQIRGRKTLVMTSTHIKKPDTAYFANTPEGVHSLWKKGQFAVAGVETEEDKLAMQPAIAAYLDGQIEKRDGASRKWQSVLRLADIILIEADGAKRLPCKAPAMHEPVIWKQTDIVIDVAGLRALGRTIQECCCRPGQVMDILRTTEEHILQPCDIARLVESPEGGRKYVGNRTYYIVLNQCDTVFDLEQAVQIVDCLSDGVRRNCVVSCLENRQSDKIVLEE